MFSVLDILTKMKSIEDLLEFTEELKDIAGSLQLKLVPVSEQEILELEILNFYQLAINDLEFRDIMNQDILAFQILKSLRLNYPEQFNKLQMQHKSILHKLEPLPNIDSVEELYNLVLTTLRLTVLAPKDFILKLTKANVFTVGLMYLSAQLRELLYHSKIFGDTHYKHLKSIYSSEITSYTLLLAIGMTLNSAYLQSFGSIDLEFLDANIVSKILDKFYLAMQSSFKDLDSYCSFLEETTPKMTELRKLQLEIQKYEFGNNTLQPTDEFMLYKSETNAFKYLAIQNWLTVLKDKKFIIVHDKKLSQNLKDLPNCNPNVFQTYLNRGKHYDLVLDLTDTFKGDNIVNVHGINEKVILHILLKKGVNYFE